MSRKTMSVRVYFSPREVRLVHSIFGTTIKMDQAQADPQPGAPGFPTRLVHVALPAGYEASRVTGRVLQTESLTYSPTFVAPVREQWVTLKDHEEPGAPTGNWVPPVTAHYQQAIKAMKRSVVRLAGSKLEGRIYVAEVAVQPVRYDEKGALELISELRITLTLKSLTEVHPRMLLAERRPAWSERRYVLATNRLVNPQAFESLRITEPKINMLEDGRAVLANIAESTTTPTPSESAPPETSGGGDPPPGGGSPPQGTTGGAPLTGSTPVTVPNEVDYLIITDQNTWDADTKTPVAAAGNLPGAFARLSNWKKSRGLRTHIATVTNIVGGSYGDFTTGTRDLQEVIRNFLKYFVWRYGTEWVLLGGDVSIIPTRLVCGSVSWGRHDFAEAEEAEAAGDEELPEGAVVWKGTFLGMRVDKNLIGDPANHTLTMINTGTIVPYDAGGPTGTSSPRWYHTTDDTFSTFSAVATEYIRVDGSAALINGKVQWYTPKNLIPADFYYASLYAPTYNQAGKHDWDLTNNGLYGQWSETTNLDGVDYQVDVGLGRAPVQSGTEVDAFIDKVIDYEKASERPADYDRFRRMLYVGEHWQREFRRISRQAGDPLPPPNNRYSYDSANIRVLLNADVLEKGLNIEVISYISESDYRIIPYDSQAGPARRGWYYARSDTDLTPSQITINLIAFQVTIPVPTRWIVIYSGQVAELTPMHIVLDSNELDGAINEQEELRIAMQGWFHRIDNVRRLYTDEPDLTLAGMAATPIQHLSDDTLRAELDPGPHFVSLSGHGNSGGCCHFGSGMVNSLSNGNKTFIIFADSCSTSSFDNEDAISERAVIQSGKGAVAYIGYSRYGWIGIGDDFRKEFFHTRANGARHLAQCNDSRFNLSGGHHLYRWHVVEQNLIGDPEMPVWRDDLDVRMAYVANKNTDELHERNCQWVERMHFKNQLFLETKAEGLTMGFDGCYYCLPEHHTR